MTTNIVNFENKFIKLDMTKEYLFLQINITPSIKIRNTSMFKLKIERFVNKSTSSDDLIFFKNTLTYQKYKIIIDILREYSNKNKYYFIVTEKIKNYILEREMNIDKRINMSTLIKLKDISLLPEFSEYKEIVNGEMKRYLREKQMWDSFYMCMMKKSSNFSVPGSGKTSSVLGVFAYLSKKEMIDRIVMIGPKNSFNSWLSEFDLSFGHKKKLKQFSIQTYKTVQEKKGALHYDIANKNLLLFNYESLESISSDIKKIITNKTLLVFDEIHRIKAINGIRAINALKISKNARYIIALTGTPIPNSYLDIKNLLEILYYDEYAEIFGFSERYLKFPSNLDIKDINKKINPFFCRTTKQELGVPNANKDAFISTFASDIENKIFNIILLKYSANHLVLVIRLLQLESNPKMLLKSLDSNGEDFSSILDTSGKIEDIEFKDYSKEIVFLINQINETKKFKACIIQTENLYREKKPVIIWCIFIDSILRLVSKLKKKGLIVEYIYGSTKFEKRNTILNNFKNGQIDVLITNPHTLAESISLHSICHDAIYFEFSYNLVHLLQSKDRIHRLGLHKNQYTQYFFLYTVFQTRDFIQYSISERIYKRLKEKEEIMLEAIENKELEKVTTTQEDLDLIFKDLKLSIFK